MLKFDIGSLEGRKEFDLELRGTDLSFDKGMKIEDGMKIHLVFTKEKNDSVIIEGSINGNLITACSRCLEEFVNTIDTSFIYMFRDRKSFTEDDKDSDVIMFENNEIDLEPLLKETIILELPMKPLCADDCRGLCPACGVNLNKEGCDCEKKVKISPFDRLDGLKIKKTE